MKAIRAVDYFFIGDGGSVADRLYFFGLNGLTLLIGMGAILL